MSVPSDLPAASFATFPKLPSRGGQRRGSTMSSDWWLVEGSLDQELRTLLRGPVPYRVAVDLRGVPAGFFDLILRENPDCESAEDWCFKQLPGIAEWLVQSSVGPLPRGRRLAAQVCPWSQGKPLPQMEALYDLGQCAMLPGAVFYLISGECGSSH
jgi:hypothetical protein